MFNLFIGIGIFFIRIMSNEDEESSSSYHRMKQRMNRKLDDVKGDMLKEIKEELEEHDNHVQDAKDMALGRIMMPF